MKTCKEQSPLRRVPVPFPADVYINVGTPAAICLLQESRPPQHAHRRSQRRPSPFRSLPQIFPLRFSSPSSIYLSFAIPLNCPSHKMPEAPRPDGGAAPAPADVDVVTSSGRRKIPAHSSVLVSTSFSASFEFLAHHYSVNLQAIPIGC